MSELTIVLKVKTTGDAQQVGLPLGKKDYFGAASGPVKMWIDWGDPTKEGWWTRYQDDEYWVYDKRGNQIENGTWQSQSSDGGGNSDHWAPVYTYTNEGTYTIRVNGGYGADANFEGGKLCFSATVTQDDDGRVESDDQRHTDSTPELFTEIKYVSPNFYLHGQGDFDGFTTLTTCGKLANASILKSDDPADSISMDNSGKVHMDRTFNNTPLLKKAHRISKLGKKIGDAMESAQQTFKDSGFNGSIRLWDAKNILSFFEMFAGATKFKGKGVARLLNPKKKAGGAKGKANPLRQFAVVDLGGMFNDAAALLNKKMRQIKHWNVDDVTDVANFLGGTTINIDLSKWNCDNVTSADNFGVSTAPSFPAAEIPDCLTVTLTDDGKGFWTDWDDPEDNEGPSAYGTYTKQAPANFSAGSVEAPEWTFDDHTGDLSAWLSDDTEDALEYYSQDTALGDHVEGFYIIVGEDKDKYLLVNADDKSSVAESSSLLSWDGGNEDYINAADLDCPE